MCIVCVELTLMMSHTITDCTHQYYIIYVSE